MLYTPYEFGPLRPLSDIEFEYLEAQVSKIGKRLFVEHYYAFQRRDTSLYEKYPENVKKDVFRKRVQAAFALFDMKLELHALYKVINSPQMPRETHIVANQIFEYELMMDDFFRKNYSYRF